MMDHSIRGGIAKKETGLAMLEAKYRAPHINNEYLPLAKNTSYVELATVVSLDVAPLSDDGSWLHPIMVVETKHATTIGIETLCKRAEKYLIRYSREIGRLDILSICAGLDGASLSLVFAVRFYSSTPPAFDNLWDYIDRAETPSITEGSYLSLYQTEVESDRIDSLEVENQKKQFELCPADVPLLNSISTYHRQYRPAEEEVYDLRTKDQQVKTLLPYDSFIEVFRTCMEYITGVERDMYYAAIKDPSQKVQFWGLIDAYIKRNILNAGLMGIEDYPALKKKLDRALFDLYIIQDLIDDPSITDIKITAPDSIRVRIKGRAYLSNVTFLDDEDYLRFISALAVKNKIDTTVPVQTFTDERDDGYVLRFSLTASYITSTGFPIIHIRKVSRRKLLAPDLINAGMMDAKLRDYLLDCGRNSRGVVFAGAPGSGKTVMLNWFLEEAYEPSAEILVIQENDELFTSRKGVMFEHVVNHPPKGQRKCTLEDLGQQALVAGANAFIIGEVKGAEICSAITLANSGCRTAMTIHSPSAEETIEKMVDLAMRGYATSYDQTKRMLKAFQTIVYLEGFKVMSITEVMGYDDVKKEMIFRKIYERDI